jgi:hypothetical protein
MSIIDLHGRAWATVANTKVNDILETDAGKRAPITIFLTGVAVGMLAMHFWGD